MNYEIKIEFEADHKDAQALYEALAQIAEAWSRHKRIGDAKVNLNPK